MMTEHETAAWLAERCGKLTASRMGAAMSFLKGGKPSAERTKYMQELLAERLTGYSVRHFVSDAMQHGLEYEDEAKMAYETHSGVLLAPSRFYDHPRIANLGATPDAEIGRDGLAEVKCPTTTTFVAWSLAGVVPEEHRPQMLAQLSCTGRKWCDFVAYDPRIREMERRLFVRRFTPTADEIASVEDAAEKFLNELEVMFDQFVTAAA